MVLFASMVMRVHSVFRKQCRNLVNAVEDFHQSLTRRNERPASIDSNATDQPDEKRAKRKHSETSTAKSQFVQSSIKARSTEPDEESGDTSSESERGSTGGNAKSDEDLYLEYQ
jgi:hypothetical protein